MKNINYNETAADHSRIFFVMGLYRTWTCQSIHQNFQIWNKINEFSCYQIDYGCSKLRAWDHCVITDSLATSLNTQHKSKTWPYTTCCDIWIVCELGDLDWLLKIQNKLTEPLVEAAPQRCVAGMLLPSPPDPYWTYHKIWTDQPWIHQLWNTSFMKFLHLSINKNIKIGWVSLMNTAKVLDWHHNLWAIGAIGI